MKKTLKKITNEFQHFFFCIPEGDIHRKKGSYVKQKFETATKITYTG